MHPLPPTPSARQGVFTAREAAAVGWTVAALKHAVRHTGRLERIRRGCFAPPPPADLGKFRVADLRLARQAVAVTLCARDTSVSHLGAALILGLPAWAAHPRPCAATTREVRLDGVHVHRTLARAGHFGLLGGVAITSPGRTVADVAREFGPEAGLVVADAAVRGGLVTIGELAAVVDELGRDLDVAAARWVLGAVDPAAESPLESRSRWHLARHDLPPPQTQVEIFSTDGEFLGRTDFFWAPGVIGEVDGTSKYVDRGVLAGEKWRQERLEDLGLQVVRWGARHLRDFGTTAARIRRALARAEATQDQRRWIAVPSR